VPKGGRVTHRLGQSSAYPAVALLLVDKVTVFESAVICEFLQGLYTPARQPPAPLQRAQHRAWIEFGSALLNLIAGFYNAVDEAALLSKASELL
jgi:glutathione S-transferase